MIFQDDTISGAVVVISEKRSVALVNVAGPIDIDLLVALSGKLNIPKIDIEKGRRDCQIRRTYGAR